MISESSTESEEQDETDPLSHPAARSSDAATHGQPIPGDGVNHGAPSTEPPATAAHDDPSASIVGENNAALAGSLVQRMDAGFSAVEAELAAIRDRLSDLARVNGRQTGIIDELRDDNHRLRSGEIAQALAPLIHDLAQLHDDLAKLGATSEGNAAELDLARRALLEALRRNGIESVEPELGSSFDPARQKAVAAVETDDRSVDQTIAEVIKDGFTGLGRDVLRPAEVLVHKYTQTAPAPPERGSTAEHEQEDS